MHDIDVIDPPPTDLETANSEPGGAPQPVDVPAATDRDALLALLRILDGVQDEDGCLVVWCADAMARDAALDGRPAAWQASPDGFRAAPFEESAVTDGPQGEADRRACGPCVATARAGRQGRRSRR